MAASISSTFDIILDDDFSGAGKSFTAPRAFTVVGISALNQAAAASTLNVKNAGTAFTGTTAAPPIAGNAVVEAQADSQGISNCNVIAANANVAAGATVLIVAGAATVRPVILHCVASGGGQTITLS
jgi:septal ring-binding cell division protein DamX